MPAREADAQRAHDASRAHAAPEEAESGGDSLPRLRQPEGMSRQSWLETVRQIVGSGGDEAEDAQAPVDRMPAGSDLTWAARILDEADAADLTAPLTIERVERMLTGPMGYGVERRLDDDGHVVLVGSWDGFPFVIEEPPGHDGLLLVAGDHEDPVSPGQRDEVAASVNDWNRDRFFPTVSIARTPVGAVVRASYIVDLSAGVSDAQLRVHLDTALSACTQALSQVRPLLPEW